jgi:hypothetical protein
VEFDQNNRLSVRPKAEEDKSVIEFEGSQNLVLKRPLKSSYAEVYKKFYLREPQNYESLVSFYKRKHGQVESKNGFTFEYSISHFAVDFKATVDYIWLAQESPKRCSYNFQILNVIYLFI